MGDLRRGRPVSGRAVSGSDRNRKYRAKLSLLYAIDRALRAGVDVDEVLWNLKKDAERDSCHQDRGDENVLVV